MGLETSLPILIHGHTKIQGSGAIINYLEHAYPDPPLTVGAAQDEFEAFERRVAMRIGVPLRRLCYFYLLDHPQLIEFCFMHRSPWLARQYFKVLYPILQQKLIEAYNITEKGAAQAQEELTTAIEHFDKMLGEREYFFGENFSRADLTFASLLAFMVMPVKYPVPWPEQFQSLEIKPWFDSFSKCSSYQHVHRTYAAHR